MAMRRLLLQTRWLWPLVVILVALGCGKKTISAAAAAEQLERSYEKTEDPVKQEVAQASAALQAGQYLQALNTMDRVAQTRQVDEAQRRAVDLLIRQAQQAVRQNPNLNTPELHRATSRLIERVHGEN